MIWNIILFTETPGVGSGLLDPFNLDLINVSGVINRTIESEDPVLIKLFTEEGELLNYTSTNIDGDFRLLVVFQKRPKSLKSCFVVTQPHMHEAIRLPFYNSH